MWHCQFSLSRNIEEGSILYVLVSPLAVDQLGRVSESKKANPRKRICPIEKTILHDFFGSKMCILIAAIIFFRYFEIGRNVNEKAPASQVRKAAQDLQLSARNSGTATCRYSLCYDSVSAALIL